MSLFLYLSPMTRAVIFSLLFPVVISSTLFSNQIASCLRWWLNQAYFVFEEKDLSTMRIYLHFMSVAEMIYFVEGALSHGSLIHFRMFLCETNNCFFFFFTPLLPFNTISAWSMIWKALNNSHSNNKLLEALICQGPFGRLCWQCWSFVKDCTVSGCDWCQCLLC